MKKIKLTQGKYALVDDKDFKYIDQWKWCYGARGYAYRGDGSHTRPRVYMHRVILEPSEDKFTDHINGDGLDNRRNNLREATAGQNQWNKTQTNRVNRYGYKGIWPTYKNRKWWAHIVVKGEQKYVGLYNTKEEAAVAYNQAAEKYFGEFAKLNTIDKVIRS